VPGEQPQDRTYVKLNTNENPYPPSPLVIEAMRLAVSDSLRLYPDPSCRELREVIARYYGLAPEQVFAGNGSDELLAFCFPAFFNPGRPVLFPDITYSFYPVYCRLFNTDYDTVPLAEDFTVPAEGFLRENGGIIIANPNAPTGRYMPLDSLRMIVEGNHASVVIVDEAYIDFGGDSAAGMIADYPNLLVIQTLSKSRCLAGLRAGFALGHADLIEGLGRVKDSFNSYTLDRIALAGAAAAFGDDAWFRKTTKKIMTTRQATASALEALGFRVVPSSANFLFVTHPAHAAAGLFRKLRDKGVLVRYFNLPRIDNYLRVTIGTDEDMARFLAAAGESIGERTGR